MDYVRLEFGREGTLIARNERFATFHNAGKTEHFDLRNPAEKSLIESVMELEYGNTDVFILTGDLLKEMKRFLKDGLDADRIIQGIQETVIELNGVINKVCNIFQFHLIKNTPYLCSSMKRMHPL